METKGRSMMLTLVALAAMASLAGAQTLTPGQRVIGEMAGPGDVQTLAVDMAEGDSLRLRMEAAGDGSEAPALAVMTPAGATLDSASGARELTVEVTAPATGTYAIRIAASPVSSTAYRLMSRGEKVRKYEARNGEPMTFGAVRGAVVRILVKGESDGTSAGPLRDGAGNELPLETTRSGAKHRARTAPLGMTGDLTLEWGGERLRLKVRYPDPGGDLLLRPGPAGTPPAAETAPPAAAEPIEPGPGDEVRYDLLVPGLMRGEMDADLAAAREALRDLEGGPIDLAAAALEELAGGGMPARMRSALEEQGLAGRPMDAGAADRMIAILDADRRNAAAVERLVLLESELPGTALAGDPTLDAAMIDAAAELGRIRDALLDATGPEIEAALWGAADAYLGSQLPPSGAANLAGAGRLNRHLLHPRILPRARAGERVALEAMIGLYGTMEQMLAECPEPTRRQERQAAGMTTTRRGLEAILAELAPPLALSAEMDPPVMGRATVILVRVEGLTDHSEVQWALLGEAGDLTIEPQPEGLRIHCPADLGDTVIRVAAMLGESAGELDIPFTPLPNDSVEIRGAAIDADLLPVEGALVTLRMGSPDGPPATNLLGEPAETRTGPDGGFSLPAVPAGEYVVVLDAPGSGAERPVTVEPPESGAGPEIDLGEIMMEPR